MFHRKNCIYNQEVFLNLKKEIVKKVGEAGEREMPSKLSATNLTNFIVS